MIIKGEEHPFRFAIKAQREMSQCKDLEKKDDIYFIWLGFKYGSMSEGKTFPFSEDQLVDIFDADMDAFGQACELLAKDMGDLKKKKAIAIKALM